MQSSAFARGGGASICMLYCEGFVPCLAPGRSRGAVVSRISIAPGQRARPRPPRGGAARAHGVAENRRFHVVDEDGRRYNQLRNGRSCRSGPNTTRTRAAHAPVSRRNGRCGRRLARRIDHDRLLRPRCSGAAVEGPWSEALSRWAGPASPRAVGAGAAVDRGRGQVSLVSRHRWPSSAAAGKQG